MALGAPLPLQVLVLRYGAFAVLATLANLGAQRAVLLAGDDAVRIAAAMLAGTAVGLVVKYLLDKRWIFYDATRGARDTGRQFGLYSAMGLVTTAIFWASQTGFWLTFGTHAARELGAVLGLTVGYVVKYRLDRAYIFVERPA